MKLFLFSLGVLLSASAATAQTTGRTFSLRDVDVGIKGGGTFTSGFTNVPSFPVGNTGVSVPNLSNKGNGIGIGYSGGLWARKNFRTFFIQTEITYNRFVLKQKTDFVVDVNANPNLVAALPFSVRNGLLNATLMAETESALQSVNVPVLFGKRWLDGRLRGYVGPNFIFVNKAELKRTTSGWVSATNPAIGFPETTIPTNTATTNLLNRYEAQNIEVKDFTYAVELGVSYSPLRFLDVDVRYAVPVGGVYRDSNITGFLGITTVSLGLKVL